MRNYWIFCVRCEDRKEVQQKKVVEQSHQQRQQEVKLLSGFTTTIFCKGLKYRKNNGGNFEYQKFSGRNVTL